MVETRVSAKTVRSLNTVQYFSAWIERNIDWDYIVNEFGVVTQSGASLSEVDGSRMISLSGNILCIQVELCVMNLEKAITKINNELNQEVDGPITPIGAFIAIQLFEEIVSGVQYLHSLGIIHRDLKPENILISDGKKGYFIRIGDFGISTFHVNANESVDGSETAQGIKHTKKRGTQKYMAPEVMSSDSYDEKCDIYSLGCIALDLLNIKW